MRKALVVLFLCTTCYNSFAQYDQRPSRSRFWNTKLATFSVQAGDTLVYNIKKGDSIFKLIATLKNYGNDIGFDYILPDQAAKGSISIEASAVSNAEKYDTLSSNTYNLKNESILWLSQKNFEELFSDRTTAMDLGNGIETFERKNTSTMKIKYKGEEKIITIYNVENDDMHSKKSLAVLSNHKNPLIVQMNAGWVFTLKEVR